MRTRRKQKTDPKLQAAQVFLDQYWQVLPLHAVVDGKCTCGREDCERPGDHPCLPERPLATTDNVTRLARWWHDFPQANLAIALGPAGGLWALEVMGEDGMKALTGLEEQYGALPRTPAVRAGDRRWYLFRWPLQQALAGVSRLRNLPLNVRADGDWVPAPDPELSEGTSCWLVSPGAGNPAEPPNWLLELVTAAPAVPSADEAAAPPDPQARVRAPQSEAVADGSTADRGADDPNLPPEPPGAPEPKIVRVRIADLVLHPAAQHVPRMRDAERQPFRESIRRDGVLNPILVQVPNIVLDGQQRWEEGRERGDVWIPAILVDLSPQEQEARVYESALLRRQLNDDQRAMLAARWQKLQVAQVKQDRARKGGRAGGRSRQKTVAASSASPGGAKLARSSTPSEPRTVRTRRRAAVAFGVSEKCVAKATKLEAASRPLADAVLAGTTTLSAAHQKLRAGAAQEAQATPVSAPSAKLTRYGSEARLVLSWPPDPVVLAQALFEGLDKEVATATHAALGACLQNVDAQPESVETGDLNPAALAEA
jgi:hypothetical protein